ncbi:hypothetical protein H6P81_007651 [Aristolochia fimbriata]|uniref:Uncharacterized protein n=1 Tax=Aristolochia fimbriata TaxID=158543 RepID=A0AAV7F100_ARIFI|nr:hypothetical protein H6P81_007651 [Aristolochia fimbriata]
MTNLMLAQRDGGHYDEEVFFDAVEASGAILDWWVATDSWRRLLASLRSVDFESKIGRGCIANFVRGVDKELPAGVNARFPTNSGELNSPYYTRRTFYRLGEGAKQHVHHLLLAASMKFRDGESPNRVPAQKAPLSPAASDKEPKSSCTSCGCPASWVNPTRSLQEATASYFMHLSALDSYKPPIYNRKKFEDEFDLEWIPATSEIAVSGSGCP